jgi:hypothetical protein
LDLGEEVAAEPAAMLIDGEGEHDPNISEETLNLELAFDGKVYKNESMRKSSFYN